MNNGDFTYNKSLNNYIPNKWVQYVDESILTIETLCNLYGHILKIEKSNEHAYGMITILDKDFYLLFELVFYSNRSDFVDCIKIDTFENVSREKDRFMKSIEFIKNNLE